MPCAIAQAISPRGRHHKGVAPLLFVWCWWWCRSFVGASPYAVLCRPLTGLNLLWFNPVGVYMLFRVVHAENDLLWSQPRRGLIE